MSIELIKVRVFPFRRFPLPRGRVSLGLWVRVRIRVRLKIRGLELGFRNRVRIMGYS